MMTALNTLFTNDNLFVLHGLNSATVDLIYLDPPFNSKRMYAAPIGSKSAGVAFKDMWTWTDVDSAYLETLVGEYPAVARFILSAQDTAGKAMSAYLAYMAQRLIEMRRVLKPTGSVYLHCDPTASHYLKVVMDGIFCSGKRGGAFRNEIVWCYRGGGVPKSAFARKHDVLLFYSKGGAPYFQPQFVPYSEASQKLVAARGGVSIDNLPRDLGRGAHMPDWWADVNSLQTWSPERLGYPTQKPVALLERVIGASSAPGDTVLDPFCGCGTALVAAQRMGRRWIGIDIERRAIDVLIERLSDDAGLFRDLVHRTDTPHRTDVATEPMSPSAKRRLFRGQGGLCNGCKTAFDERNLEIDHIVPKAKGGGDYYENYQLLCGNCNRVKGSRPMEYLLSRLRAVDSVLQRTTFGA